MGDYRARRFASDRLAKSRAACARWRRSPGDRTSNGLAPAAHRRSCLPMPPHQSARIRRNRHAGKGHAGEHGALTGLLMSGSLPKKATRRPSVRQITLPFADCHCTLSVIFPNSFGKLYYLFSDDYRAFPIYSVALNSGPVAA